MMLTASDEALRAAPAERFARAVPEWLVLSVLLGVGMALLFGLSWPVFGEQAGLRLLPAAMVSTAMLLGPFRRSAAALAERVAGPDGRDLASACLAVLLTVALGTLKPDAYLPESTMPAWAAWMSPGVKIYRVLYLMPLWGAWSVCATMQFFHPSERTNPALARAAPGVGPLACAVLLGGLMALTIQNFRFMDWRQLVISGGTIAAALGAGAGLCLADGGLTRRALLGAQLLTQLAFVLIYQGVRHWLIG